MDKEDVENIYNGILLSHKKKIWPFATTWKEIESIMLSEISQSEEDKYHMISFICGIKKIKQMNIGGKKNKERRKPRNRLLTIENKLMVTIGEVGGR